MILIVGGRAQGKTYFAENELNIAPEYLLDDLDKLIWDFMEEGKDPHAEVALFIEQNKPQAVICREVGLGIAPLGEFEREWREAVGRISCCIAKQADAVYRLYAGIPVKLK